MFGNFERFDEQHSHSLMELVWKWVTRKFEEKGNQEFLQEEEASKPSAAKKSNTSKSLDKKSTEDE